MAISERRSWIWGVEGVENAAHPRCREECCQEPCFEDRHFEDLEKHALEGRYARGEIDDEEFERRRARLVTDDNRA